jgi:hypothetical protein
MESTPYRQIRALFDDETIAVYQAYAPEIAEPALAAAPSSHRSASTA